jgi:Amt family ammonium transporter
VAGAEEAVADAAAPAAAAPATPAAPTPYTADEMVSKLWVAADTVWVLVCGMLVFFMNLGFGCVESGFARSKNCVNILSKNFIVFAATSLAYFLFGWDLMFGAGDGAFIGNSGSWMVMGSDNSPAVGDKYQGVYGSISWASVPLWTKFFFQLVFAGTAATIVSGAVAERIKYHSFVIFSFIMALLIYPVTGHWIWGFGYLAKEWNFWDFAGCTAVHSVGGWAALTGAIILGPRIGKYGADGKPRALPGHNMMAAFIGCLVLWFGWFGFNPGSTFGVAENGGALASQVAVNTNMAAAAATLTATLTAWLLLGKPDIGMTLNGCLAGLVGITASAAFTNIQCSAIIGAIAGVLVVERSSRVRRFRHALRGPFHDERLVDQRGQHPGGLGGRRWTVCGLVLRRRGQAVDRPDRGRAGRWRLRRAGVCCLLADHQGCRRPAGLPACRGRGARHR